MRILVTGANGQLGNEMQVLAKENPQHLYYFTDVQELDICDKEAVWSYISEKQIDVIVNWSETGMPSLICSQAVAIFGFRSLFLISTSLLYLIT